MVMFVGFRRPISDALDFFYDSSRDLLLRVSSIMAKTSIDLAICLPFGLVACKVLPPVNIIVRSKQVRHCINVAVALTTGLLQLVICSLLPKIQTKIGNCSAIFAAAMAEELVFRGGLQSIILRDEPKRLLRQIAPEHENIVDHKVAKVLRVVVTAAIFALAHERFFDSRGFLVPQFLGGLYFGYLYETGTSLFDLSCIHALSNMGIMRLAYSLRK